MIFVTGFVHSDPHPGNILVKKDPKDKDVTVFLLDHGLYAVSFMGFQILNTFMILTSFKILISFNMLLSLRPKF